MESGKRVLGISAASRKAQCSEGTMRSAEARGIVRPERDSAGRRLYDDEDVARMRAYLRELRSRKARR